MKKLTLIRDGMNLPFSLQPWGKDEATLSGVFRPMTPAEVADYQDAVARQKGNRTAAAAERIAERVVNWDVPDADPTAANVAALPVAFFDALELVVTGYARTGAGDDEKKS